MRYGRRHMNELPGDANLGRFYDLPFIGMAITSPSSKRWRFVNQALCDILGYQREELVEKSWADLTHSDDLAADTAEFDKVVRGATNGYKLEKRFIRKDGEVIHASLDVKCERGADGSIDQFLVTVADITDRVAKEAALRAGSDLLLKLAQQVPGVIYQFRLFPDGRSCFPFASDSIAEIYEVTPEQVRHDASMVFSRLHPEDFESVSQSIAESAASMEPWQAEYRVVLPRQGAKWLRGLARPERLDDGSVLWHGFITDVSSRKRAENELERLNAAIASSINGIATADLSGALTYVNQAMLDLWGYASSADVLGRTATEFWASPARATEVLHALEQRGADSGEMVALRSDGALRDLQFSANYFRAPNGAPMGLLASFVDITERKRTEQALRIKDLAVANALNAIVITDAAGVLQYVNPAFLRLFGIPSIDIVLGRNARELAVGIDLATIILGLATSGVWQGEVACRRSDGTLFDAQVAANVVRDAHGEVLHLMGSLADTTESKRLQGQLIQAQKTESIGRLAGGVAHDFNNLLTVMKGFLDLARSQVAPDSALGADLGQVDQAIDSASDLTRQLLAYSRKQIIHPQVLDFNESVSRLHSMISRLLGEQIQLELQLAQGLWPVRFDPGQSEQILINLAANARDAMLDGGRLIISTSNLTVDQHSRTRHPDIAPGDYVLLSVSDSGTGMTAAVQAHAFEPFFTTKASGSGTGLGLAMIHGAVTQHDGFVRVESEPLRGSTFRLYLPRVQHAEVAPPATVSDAPPRGSESIVVVEDEEPIRRLAVRVLSKLGYRVEAFGSGQLALQALAERSRTPNAEPVGLVLTDVIMPGMNGRELAEQVRARYPTVPVLFASGYTEDVIAHHGVLRDNVDFLEKPYSALTLARRVRAALDRSQSV